MLAEIYQAGYSSVDDFIDRLRVRRWDTRYGSSALLNHSTTVRDPFTGSVYSPLGATSPLAGLSRPYPEISTGDPIDPEAVTEEFPVIQRMWVIPELRAS
ncbi:MAG: hypothetical protein J2P18_09590 [Nocardia sp.]|nr:hypothetical protein [Nocardia sp.]